MELTPEIKKYMMDEMTSIHIEAYNKGAIGALKMVKKFIGTGENISVENVLLACNVYIEEIGKL